ncbi:MAG: hypothetical protein ABSF15_26670 [Candidatus Sulfotelmatobacter sp.]
MRPTEQLESREAGSGTGANGGAVSTPLSPVPEGPPKPASGGWFRKTFSFIVVLTTLLVSLAFMMENKGIQDPDIWWHLRNAEYLFQHHQLPRQDMFSFTVAGAPWINHEWLAEVPYYLAWRAAGLVGIKSLTIAVIVLVFLGLLYLCNQESRNFKASVAACSVCVFLATVSFGPRTVLFGYLYLVILLIILQRFRQKGTAPLWLIPPLFCLWINTHGSWSLGLIVFGIISAAGLVKGKWGRVEAEAWTPAQFRKLLITGLASVAALFVNPFGARLVLYPFDLAFHQKLNISHVAEWVSVDFHDSRGKLVLLVLIGFFLSALLRNRRWTLTELGLLLFALYSGLTYIRFLFLLAVLAAPLMAKLMDFMPPYRPEADTPVVNVFVILLLLGAMVYYHPNSAVLERSVAQMYPAEAVSFLKAHPPDGRMLNFYLWGGYLGWNDRDLKMFVDSRVDIFEYAGVLQDYLDLLALKQPQSLLDKYRIRYVLFPPTEPLTYVLEHDPRWKVIYSDKVSVMFERTAEAPLGPAGKETPNI